MDLCFLLHPVDCTLQPGTMTQQFAKHVQQCQLVLWNSLVIAWHLQGSTLDQPGQGWPKTDTLLVNFC